MGAMKQQMLDEFEQGQVCPYGKDRFKHCFRCNSKDPDVYWDSCANRETREACDWAMDRDD